MKVFSMSQDVTSLPKEIHIVPIGEWKERGFRITAEDCDDIIRNFDSFGIKLVIDYEHQSLNCNGNGSPAPAAGWIGKLEKRENGVWATDLEWTEDAKKYIEGKQYRYISPVIVFDDRDPHTDTWIGCSLHSVALTNVPYFRDDLEAIVNSRYTNNKPAEAGAKKEKSMTLEEQIAALKAENASQATQVEALKRDLAKQNETLQEQETNKLVEDAIAAKKLLPAQKEVGLIVAKQGKDAFAKFIACNVLPDLTKPDSVPEAGADSVKYEDLLKDPVRFEKFKKDQPEALEAARKAFYKE